MGRRRKSSKNKQKPANKAANASTSTANPALQNLEAEEEIETSGSEEDMSSENVNESDNSFSKHESKKDETSEAASPTVSSPDSKDLLKEKTESVIEDPAVKHLETASETSMIQKPPTLDSCAQKIKADELKTGEPESETKNTALKEIENVKETKSLEEKSVRHSDDESKKEIDDTHKSKNLPQEKVETVTSPAKPQVKNSSPEVKGVDHLSPTKSENTKEKVDELRTSPSATKSSSAQSPDKKIATQQTVESKTDECNTLSLKEELENVEEKKLIPSNSESKETICGTLKLENPPKVEVKDSEKGQIAPAKSPTLDNPNVLAKSTTEQENEEEKLKLKSISTSPKPSNFPSTENPNKEKIEIEQVTELKAGGSAPEPKSLPLKEEREKKTIMETKSSSPSGTESLEKIDNTLKSENPPQEKVESKESEDNPGSPAKSCAINILAKSVECENLSVTEQEKLEEKKLELKALSISQPSKFSSTENPDKEKIEIEQVTELKADGSAPEPKSPPLKEEIEKKNIMETKSLSPSGTESLEKIDNTLKSENPPQEKVEAKESEDNLASPAKSDAINILAKSVECENLSVTEQENLEEKKLELKTLSIPQPSKSSSTENIGNEKIEIEQATELKADRSAPESKSPSLKEEIEKKNIETKSSSSSGTGSLEKIDTTLKSENPSQEKVETKESEETVRSKTDERESKSQSLKEEMKKKNVEETKSSAEKSLSSSSTENKKTIDNTLESEKSPPEEKVKTDDSEKSSASPTKPPTLDNPYDVESENIEETKDVLKTSMNKLSKSFSESSLDKSLKQFESEKIPEATTSTVLDPLCLATTGNNNDVCKSINPSLEENISESTLSDSERKLVELKGNLKASKAAAEESINEDKECTNMNISKTLKLKETETVQYEYPHTSMATSSTASAERRSANQVETELEMPKVLDKIIIEESKLEIPFTDINFSHWECLPMFPNETVVNMPSVDNRTEDNDNLMELASSSQPSRIPTVKMPSGDDRKEETDDDMEIELPLQPSRASPASNIANMDPEAVDDNLDTISLLQVPPRRTLFSQQLTTRFMQLHRWQRSSYFSRRTFSFIITPFQNFWSYITTRENWEPVLRYQCAGILAVILLLIFLITRHAGQISD